MSKTKVFTIPKEDYSEETYARGNRRWLTAKLIAASKGIPETDLHINSIDTGMRPWEDSIGSIYDFLSHVQRVNNTDLKHPVLLDNEGGIINGWHRVCKAWLEGKETIKAKRFENMPMHDRIEEDSE